MKCCPCCGSVAVTHDKKAGIYRCHREGCEHSERSFPSLWRQPDTTRHGRKFLARNSEGLSYTSGYYHPPLPVCP